MKHFLGLDSSTQSLSALILDTDSGTVVAEATLNFGRDLPEFNCPQGVLAHSDPLVRQADPLMWVAALDRLFAVLQAQGIDLSRIAGISGSGQQHGTVYLNDRFLRRAPISGNLVDALRPALSRSTAPIWMDSSTSEECREMAAAAGGAETVRQRSGSPPVERFSGPQIRKFFKQEPAAYNHTAVIHLVSSFMASILTGQSAGIDLGDGTGMNLLNLKHHDWDPLLLQATAPGLREKLPPAIPSGTMVGEIAPRFVSQYGFRPGTPVIAWSGDNPSSLIGAGAWKPGICVISLGTSHTFFAAMPEPKVDPAGFGHVFGNPAGGFMSLICFKNGALATEQVRDRYHLDWSGFDASLARTPAGNRGNLMLPYFIPEITPLILDAKPEYRGDRDFVEGRNGDAAVRAIIEAQACRLRLHAAWMGVPTDVVRVTGGGAASRGICQVLADVFNARVERLESGNSAALGAAIRAAQAVTGATWEALSAAFCRTPESATITGIPDHVRIYDKQLVEYAKFADQYGTRH